MLPSGGRTGQYVAEQALVFGRYTVERRLGDGGMGVVYLAVSPSGRRVAVKVVREEYSADPVFRSRFAREVAAARLVSGAFTASVVDADPDGSPPWLATLYLPGPTLSEEVDSHGPLSPDRVRQLAVGLAEAMYDIHRAGVVHRDMKPGNILLTEDGPYVIDFGISRATGHMKLTTTGRVFGTPPFMAPEQFLAPEETGRAADVFAIGSVLVYAATGHGPFDAENPYMVAYKVVHDEPDLSGVPKSLVPLMRQCLAKSADDRPNPQQLMQHLDTGGTHRSTRKTQLLSSSRWRTAPRHTEYGTTKTGGTSSQTPVALPAPALVSVPTGTHNLPRPASNQFVGREQELELIERALHRDRGTVARAAAQTLSGLGGIGKTTLALHYAHGRRLHHTAVWWINAETPESITASFAQFAVQANPHIDTCRATSEALATWALAWLEAHPGWLLIFDNATEPGHIAPHLTRLTGGDHVITTRRTHGWHDLTPTPLRVAALPAPATAVLLLRLSGPGHADEEAAARALAEELGCLPLAVEQAAAHIHRTCGTLSGYLDRLRTQTARMLAAPGDGDPHSTTVASTWRVTLDTIAERDTHAIHLLRALAWLAPSGVPRSLLRLVGDDPGRTDDALALLADFSMITLTRDATTTHRLVQALARTPDPADPHRTEQAIQQARTAVTAALRVALPDGPPETMAAEWARWRALSPNIDALLAHTRPDQDTDDVRHILSRATRFMNGQSRPGPTTAYAERAVVASTRLHGADHPTTLSSRSALARAYRAAGNPHKAVQLLEAAAASCMRLFGAEHATTLATRTNLARAHRAAGNLQQATQSFEEILRTNSTTLGADHPETLSTCNYLAYTCLCSGDLERAIELYEQSLAGHERAVGTTHPDTLNASNNLAFAYQTAGDSPRALPNFERSLSEHERILGVSHPDTLLSGYCLACAHLMAGHPHRAIELLEELLIKGHQVLGTLHASAVVANSVLAAACRRIGDFDRAVDLFGRSLAICEQLAGPDHPHTLSARSDLAFAYLEAGEPERAIPVIELLLATSGRVLAGNLRTTSLTRGKLTYVYRTAGEPELTLAFYEQALGACQDILGTHHPTTCAIRDELAQHLGDTANFHGIPRERSRTGLLELSPTDE